MNKGLAPIVGLTPGGQQDVNEAYVEYCSSACCVFIVSRPAVSPARNLGYKLTEHHFSQWPSHNWAYVNAQSLSYGGINKEKKLMANPARNSPTTEQEKHWFVLEQCLYTVYSILVFTSALKMIWTLIEMSKWTLQVHILQCVFFFIVTSLSTFCLQYQSSCGAQRVCRQHIVMVQHSKMLLLLAALLNFVETLDVLTGNLIMIWNWRMKDLINSIYLYRQRGELNESLRLFK